MTGAEAVAYIQRHAGFRTDKDDIILEELNAVQKELERGRTLPRFLIQEDQNLNFSADSDNLPLPSGFIKVVDDGWPHFTLSDGAIRYLDQASWDHLEQLYATDDSGSPKAFAIRRRHIYIAPTPDEDKTLQWSYYAKAAAITSGGTNAWLNETSVPEGAPYLLIGLAGARLGGALQLSERAINHFNEIAARWGWIVFNDTVEWETAGPVQMGSEYLGA